MQQSFSGVQTNPAGQRTPSEHTAVVFSRQKFSDALPSRQHLYPVQKYPKGHGSVELQYEGDARGSFPSGHEEGFEASESASKSSPYGSKQQSPLLVHVWVGSAQGLFSEHIPWALEPSAQSAEHKKIFSCLEE